jgi:hypothetical protein
MHHPLVIRRGAHFRRHAFVFTSQLSHAWLLAASTEDVSPFGSPAQQHVATACGWSAMQPGLAHLLFVSEGSEAQVRLPQALAAEAVGAAAMLTWRKVLLDVVDNRGGGGSRVMRTAGLQLRQVRCKPRCPFCSSCCLHAHHRWLRAGLGSRSHWPHRLLRDTLTAWMYFDPCLLSRRASLGWRP